MRILLTVALLGLAACTSTTGREIATLRAPDGNSIYVPVPPPEVLESRRSLDLKAQIPGLSKSIEAGGSVDIAFTQIRPIVRDLQMFEVFQYHIATAYASGAISSETYRAWTESVMARVLEGFSTDALPLAQGVKAELVIGAEKKNEHYGVYIDVTAHANGAAVVSHQNSLNGVRAEGLGKSFALFQSAVTTPVRRGSGVHVRVTSQHNASGPQFEGVWEGNVILEFLMSDGTARRYVSPHIRMNHEGGLFAPNHPTRVFEYDIPSL